MPKEIADASWYTMATAAKARRYSGGVCLACALHACHCGGASASAGARTAAAVGEGFSADDAMRSITLSSAEVLGVADQLGSLQVGKLGTLIIADGNPLEITTNVQRAFIRGSEIDLSSRHTKLYKKYLEKQRRLGQPSESR